MSQSNVENVAAASKAAVKQVAEATAAAAEQVCQANTAAVGQVVEVSTAAVGEITEANTAAMTDSGHAAGAALKELSKAYQELATRNAEKLKSSIQALTAVKSVKEFVEVEQRLIKEGVQAAVEDTKNIAHLTTAVFTAAFEPVKKRIEAMRDHTALSPLIFRARSFVRGLRMPDVAVMVSSSTRAKVPTARLGGRVS